VADRPDADWVTQQARNLVIEVEEHGRQARFLIRDHDSKFGGGSDLVFQSQSIEVIKTPIAAPQANSHVERQIGSTRQECLDWLLIVDRKPLEWVLAEWVEHYNRARPHRGLELRTPIARSDPVIPSGAVRCRSRLGGLLLEYECQTLHVAA
jgi:putative transposase